MLLSLIALPLAAARPRSRIRSPKSGSTPVGQRTLSGKTFPSMEDHSPNGRLDLSAFDGCPVYRDFLTPEELSVIDFSSCAVFDFTNVKFVEHGSVNLDCLFPTVPTYKQVDQGRIGDCYLVSSIKSSLVYGWGSRFIQESMIAIEDEEAEAPKHVNCGGRDVPGTPTAVVRMFLNGVPIGIKMRKRQVKSSGFTVTGGSSGLWLGVLEQAYGYHKYLQQLVEYQQMIRPEGVIDELKALFVNLDRHGHPTARSIDHIVQKFLDFIERKLTAVDASPSRSIQPARPATHPSLSSADVTDFLGELAAYLIKMLPMDPEEAEATFQTRLQKCKLQEGFARLAGNRLVKARQQGFPKLAPLQVIISGGFQYEVANAYYGLKLLKAKVSVQLPRDGAGKWAPFIPKGYAPPTIGEYTEEENRIFGVINQGLKGQNPMTASADFVGENHAFSVLGVSESDDRRWILLSNPWRKSVLITVANILTKDTNGIHTCVTHKDGQMILKTSRLNHNMVFWMEFRHFTRLFSEVEIMSVDDIPVQFRCSRCIEEDPFVHDIRLKLRNGPMLTAC